MRSLLGNTKYKNLVGHRVFGGASIWAILIILMGNACATADTKYLDPDAAVAPKPVQEVIHTFYLIGDAGLSPMDTLNPVLLRFRDRLAKATGNTTAIFLGDNIYPAGLPKKSDPAYTQAKNNLDAQLKTLKDFKGSPVFIPGNHDWYNDGIKGLELSLIHI